MAYYWSFFKADLDMVQYLNKYAQFFGFLSMAINGLGYLVLTWTTVVLLGGFVSILHKKDFWCLTFITFVQITRITDPTLDEKLGKFRISADVMMVGAFRGVVSGEWLLQSNLASIALLFWSCMLGVLQLVVLYAILCPLVIVYSFGMMISGGISLWRLIEHNYGDGQVPNLEPALDTLYYLALLQGVLVCYKTCSLFTRRRMAKSVAVECDDRELEVLNKYLQETTYRCQNDPSFVNERNLVTQAVDMIGSKSLVDYVSGVKVLYTAISIAEKKVKHWGKESYLFNKYDGTVLIQSMVMKHLVLSASSENILQKLLEMLDLRGLHNTETRQQAAMIVERLAFDINLEQFPRGIQQISSLIGMFQLYHRECLHDEFEQNWILQYSRRFPLTTRCYENYGAYEELLLQGLSIFRKLATDENNCRVMSNTPDLVSKIMVPITSDLLHQTVDDHGAWSDVVLKSLEVMSQLTVAPGENGAKLRREISSCKEAVSTLQRILSCDKCKKELQQRAIQILTRLYMDTTEGSREEFISMLVDIFTNDKKYNSVIKGYAACALSTICFHGGISEAKIVIDIGGGDVVDSLTKVLIHEKNKTSRQAAAEILEYLCTHYTNDDDQYLGTAIIKVMPEVLGEILHWGDETRNGTEADQNRFPKPVTDIESQSDGNSQDKENIYSSSSCKKNDEQGEDEKESVRSATLLSSLLSLCGTVYDMPFIGDLTPQLDTSSFLNKLKEMVLVEKEIDHPMVENLLLCKAVGKMVISMMKHSGCSFFKQQDIEGFIEAFSGASKKMRNIDCYMAFRSTTTSSKLNRRTLASIVKEAKELDAMVSSTSASG